VYTCRNHYGSEVEATDDAEVIAAVSAGDRDAFRLLVDRYGALAQRTARLLGAGADADDVVQESFVRAYRALPTFRAGEPFRPWLLRIVVNQAHNAHRGRTRAEAAIGRLAGLRDPLPADAPADAAISGERRRDLLAALARLRPTDREVLTLRFLLELSEAETATALDVAPGTVKSRTARSLGRLRDAMNDRTRPDDRIGQEVRDA
jgi:RNA polymerase sigma-70 factor (ECF subfamily)